MRCTTVPSRTAWEQSQCGFLGGATLCSSLKGVLQEFSTLFKRKISTCPVSSPSSSSPLSKAVGVAGRCFRIWGAAVWTLKEKDEGGFLSKRPRNGSNMARKFKAHVHRSIPWLNPHGDLGLFKWLGNLNKHKEGNIIQRLMTLAWRRRCLRLEKNAMKETKAIHSRGRFSSKLFLFRKLPLNSVTTSQAPAFGLGTFFFFKFHYPQRPRWSKPPKDFWVFLQFSFHWICECSSGLPPFVKTLPWPSPGKKVHQLSWTFRWVLPFSFLSRVAIKASSVWRQVLSGQELKP